MQSADEGNDYDLRFVNVSKTATKSTLVSLIQFKHFRQILTAGSGKRKPMQFSKLNFLLFLFSVFFYTGAFGQSSVESPNYPNRFVVRGLFSQTKESNLLITVKDQFDGVITTAQISVAKIGSDDKIQVQTDDSGTAKIRNLVDGEYQITVSAAGFKEYKVEKITLKSGSTIRLDVVLEIASIESNVNVSESESVDPDRSAPAVVLNEKNLNNLPNKQEDFERAL